MTKRKLLRQLNFHEDFVNNKLIINTCLFSDLLIAYINLCKMWNMSFKKTHIFVQVSIELLIISFLITGFLFLL